MAIKRKAVVKGDSSLFKKRCGEPSKKVEKDEAMGEDAKDGEEEHEEQEEEEQEEGAETVEEKAAREEREAAASRAKELKGMYIDQLKELASSKGLEPGKKEEMIKAVLNLEAQERSRVREHEAKLRAAVVQKQEELSSLSAPELKQLCSEKGIGGVLSKQARVEELLKQWQAQGGVEKALTRMAQAAREEELRSMDEIALKQLCDAGAVNPFVREVIVERIVRREASMGRFNPPTAQKELEKELEPEEPVSKKGSMVDAILANEARLKHEKELQQQQEEQAQKKFKEFKAMSIEELKKALAKEGKKDATGKKDELAQALFVLHMQAEEEAKKKAKLQALGLEQLKKLAASRGLQTEKKEKAEKLVDALLAEEKRLHEATVAYEAKLQEVLAKKKEELEEKTANELKDLCVSKGLPQGVGKEPRIERLLEEAKTSGEADKILMAKAREERTAELQAENIEALQKLCVQLEVEPLIKDIMIERLIAHESTCGPIKLDKKGRASKK